MQQTLNISGLFRSLFKSKMRVFIKCQSKRVHRWRQVLYQNEVVYDAIAHSFRLWSALYRSDWFYNDCVYTRSSIGNDPKKSKHGPDVYKLMFILMSPWKCWVSTEIMRAGDSCSWRLRPIECYAIIKTDICWQGFKSNQLLVFIHDGRKQSD